MPEYHRRLADRSNSERRAFRRPDHARKREAAFHARLCIVCVALCSCTFGARVCAGFDKQRILSEWRKLSQEPRSMRSERAIDSFFSREGKPLKLARRYVLKNSITDLGMTGSFETEYFDENGAVKERHERLELFNHQYNAVLRRTKARDGWLLTDLKSKAGEQIDEKTRFAVTCPWLVCGNIWLPDWIADGSFVVSRAEAIGANLLRVHFTYDKSRKQSSDAPDHVKSGYIDFDPGHSHRTMGYEYHLKTPFSEGTERGTFEYLENEGLPLLKKITAETPEMRGAKFGLRSSKDIQTYKIEYNVAIPDEEFRLSFYGLPEPTGVTWKRPVPIYLWLLLGAGLVAMLALGARYLARRMKS